MCAPAWAAVGVQLKVVLTPVLGPVTGSAGVRVAPGGMPPLCSVTWSAGSASVPVTMKLNGCPASVV